MPTLFAVILSRGPAWNDPLPLEGQVAWAAHAAFMDGLVDKGIVVLGGPLEGSRDVLLIVRAEDPDEIARCLSADPWHRNGLLVVKHAWPWRIRLGSLP